MWTRQPTSNAPLARCAHAADSVDGKLYVFGGWSEVKVFNDLHVYDPDTQMWTKLQDDKIDPNILASRSGHSITSVGKKLLIFGGGSSNESGNFFLNDVLFFDVEQGRWNMAYACGPTPAGRTKHTATLVGSRLFVFGGGDGLRLYNDLFCLDIETMTWSAPSCKGTPPCPRWGHTTVQVGNQLVVFGGHDGLNRLSDVHIYDTETMTWRQEMCSRRSPPEGALPCAGHTATMVGPHMLVIGGGDGRVLTEMYALDTRNWQWWWAGSAPGTCAHTTTAVGNKLIVFGGGDGVFCFNDLYTLDITDKLEALFQAKPQNLKAPSPSKHPQVQAPPLASSPPKNARPPTTPSPRNNNNPPPTTTLSPPSNSPQNTTQQTDSPSLPSTLPPSLSPSPSHPAENPPSLHATPTAPTPAPPNPPNPPKPPTQPPPSPSKQKNAPSQSGNSPTGAPAAPAFSGDASAVAVNGNSGSAKPPPISIPSQSPPAPANHKSRRGSKSRSNNTTPTATPTATPTSTPPASPRDPPQNPNPFNAPNNPNSAPNNSNKQGAGNNANGGGESAGGEKPRSRRNSRARKEDRPPSIAKWLSGLGMSKYLDRFVAEEIDVDVLDMCNENHFKQLGIPLGDRLRLCVAINKLSETNKI